MPKEAKSCSTFCSPSHILLLWSSPVECDDSTTLTLTLHDTECQRLITHLVTNLQISEHLILSLSLIPPSMPPVAGYLLCSMLVAAAPAHRVQQSWQNPRSLPHKPGRVQTYFTHVHILNTWTTHDKASKFDKRRHNYVAHNKCAAHNKICESFLIQPITHLTFLHNMLHVHKLIAWEENIKQKLDRKTSTPLNSFWHIHWRSKLNYWSKIVSSLFKRRTLWI